MFHPTLIQSLGEGVAPVARKLVEMWMQPAQEVVAVLHGLGSLVTHRPCPALDDVRGSRRGPREKGKSNKGKRAI